MKLLAGILLLTAFPGFAGSVSFPTRCQIAFRSFLNDGLDHARVLWKYFGQTKTSYSYSVPPNQLMFDTELNKLRSNTGKKFSKFQELDAGIEELAGNPETPPALLGNILQLMKWTPRQFFRPEHKVYLLKRHPNIKGIEYQFIDILANPRTHTSGHGNRIEDDTSEIIRTLNDSLTEESLGPLGAASQSITDLVLAERLSPNAAVRLMQQIVEHPTAHWGTLYWTTGIFLEWIENSFVHNLKRPSHRTVTNFFNAVLNKMQQMPDQPNEYVSLHINNAATLLRISRKPDSEFY